MLVIYAHEMSRIAVLFDGKTAGIRVMFSIGIIVCVARVSLALELGLFTK